MSHLPYTTPARGWTPELKAQFLDRLAALGNVRAACRAVRLSAEAAYRLRRRDAMFARGWAAALVLARDNGEQVLGERAIEGVVEDIYYRGEHIGTRRRFDSRLLLAHLARLDRLADEAQADAPSAGADTGRFDELLVAIAQDAQDLRPDRDALLDTAEWLGARDHRRGELKFFYTETEDGETPADRKEYEAEFLANLEQECEIAGRHARADAKEELAAERAAMLEAVDALCGWPGAPGAPDLPRDPEEAVPEMAAAAVAAACPDGTEDIDLAGEKVFPRTLSTVSTSALASSLSDRSPTGFATTPRSPFSAPRDG